MLRAIFLGTFDLVSNVHDDEDMIISPLGRAIVQAENHLGTFRKFQE